MRYKEEEIIIPELEDAPDTDYRQWSQKEEAILRRYYGKKRVADIAKYLNRSITSINGKANRMGLRNREDK